MECSDKNITDDWRLQGQEKYLQQIELIYQDYRPIPPNDHDHCEFCGKKFVPKDTLKVYSEDVLTAGYSSLDRYHWICVTCYNDFKNLFKWILCTQ